MIKFSVHNTFIRYAQSLKVGNPITYLDKIQNLRYLTYVIFELFPLVLKFMIN